MSELYPMLIEPRYDERIWGGHRLAAELGLPAPPDKLIGEAWEIYEYNPVTNGPYSGKTIEDLRRIMGRDLTGHVPPDALFPLLTKIIDAREALSVQVHPDDRFAEALEHQPYGKTECWYILAAEPGAALTYGFSRSTNPDEYAALVRSGELETVLRQVPVKPGDVVYIPAGTVHAIGAGILLFELQQTSDVTYRIYDWNRLDDSGKPRQLHVEKAQHVLDYHRSQRALVQPLHQSGSPRSTLIAAPYFTLQRVEPGVEMATENSPIAICAVGGPLSITAAGQTVELPAYTSVLVPAAAGNYRVDAAGGAAALVGSVPTSRAQTDETLRGEGFSEAEIERFLAQFAPAEALGQPAS